MDPEPTVFDISSDDESSCGGEGAKVFDWLEKFLEIDDDGNKKPSSEGSDDVVILREVKSTGKSKSSKPTVIDDDDDDCVVLDGDPDNPTVDGDSNSSGGSDELLIVGEKGQIACRDFPHPRHHCASFPFGTTQHEEHCFQCHCYVCDLPAPCALWATRNSSSDHCHATDKEETWKTQRKNLKLGKNSPLPASNLYETFPTVGLPQISPPSILRSSPNSILRNQVSRPATTVQACSSTNFSSPAILSRSRNPQSVQGLPKNRFQPRIISGGQGLAHGINHNSQRARGSQLIGNSGNHLLRLRPPPFKRPASGEVTLPVGQTTHSSSNSRNCAGAGPYFRPPTPAMAPNNSIPIRWENVNSTAHQSSSGPNLVTTCALSTPTSQQQLYSHPNPHENQFTRNGESVYQYGNETQNSGQSPYSGGIQSASVKASYYDPSWVINACQNDQLQPDQQQPPPVEHSQLQGTEPSNELFVESNSELTIGDSNFCSDYTIGDWLPDDPFVPMVSDGGCISPQSNNIFSPEPTSIDAGFLFDFETSWNGLTHA